jgi:hypothetical protein
MACLEFLVARGVARSIFYTRLPVGHTHEDIDACFGLVWNWFKKKTIFHPEQYKTELELAMADSRIPTKVIDVFALPDYKLFFNRFIDQSLSHLHREDDTKLQWNFQAVPRSNKFPLGVKTMYRSYASDQVIMLKQVNQSQAVSPIGRLTGLEPYTVLVRWEPASDGSASSTPGMTVLNAVMPVLRNDEALQFTDFAVDGISSIFSTITSCMLQWGGENDKYIRDMWLNWQTLCFPVMIETANELSVRRHISSPMSMLFQSHYCVLQVFDYTNNNQYKLSEGVYNFSWPQNVAVTNASVRCSSNPHPPAPLTFMNLSNNGMHDEPIDRFIENTKEYYHKIIGTALHIKDLDHIMHRKMKFNGDSMPSMGRSKRDKVEILILWDQNVIRNRFQVLPDASLDFIKDLFSERNELGNTIPNISVCAVNGHNVFRDDFKCFVTEKCIKEIVLIVYINLLQERDNILFKVRDDLNSTKAKPLPIRKKSLYMSPLSDINSLSYVIHRIDVVYCRMLHRLYIPIYSDTNSALVVIHIESHSICYYDPLMKYDCQKQTEYACIRDELKTLLLPLCESLNGEIHTIWEITLSPKWVNGVTYFPVLSDLTRHDAGIYLMIIMEYLYFDLPIYFNKDDVEYYRKLFCFNIAKKCIPNV